MLKRLSVFAYGLICYAVFFASYLYAVGFVGNLLVPRTIDGTPAGSSAAGVVVDLVLLLASSLALIALFAFWLPLGGIVWQ
jgi:hypothetical protein